MIKWQEESREISMQRDQKEEQHGRMGKRPGEGRPPHYLRTHCCRSGTDLPQTFSVFPHIDGIEAEISTFFGNNPPQNNWEAEPGAEEH